MDYTENLHFSYPDSISGISTKNIVAKYSFRFNKPKIEKSKKQYTRKQKHKLNKL